VLVAPGSGEDQARIAALNSGERALAGPADGASAAQISQHLHTAAALASVQPARALDVDLGKAAAVHCTQCGTLAPQGARYCAHCGSALLA